MAGYTGPSYYPGRQDNSIADLILQQGRARAEGAARSGEIWSHAIDQLGQIAGAGVQHYADQKNQNEIGQAVLAATSPQYPSATKPGPVGSGAPIDPGSYEGPPGMTPDMSGRVPDSGQDHMANILASVAPENRLKVIAGVQATQEQAAKVSAALADAQEKTLKVHNAIADTMGTFALGLKQHLGEADGGIGLANSGLAPLAASGIHGLSEAAQQFQPFAAQAAQHLAAAKASGDPAQVQAVVDAWRQQVVPYLDKGADGMTLEGQKTWAEKQKALSEANRPENVAPNHSLVVDNKAVYTQPAEPPKASTLEEQIAAAQVAGDQPLLGKLLRAKSLTAAAGRDPEAAAARADAAATREAARFDAQTNHSYEYNDKKLEARAKPLTDASTRLDRLVTTLNQKTAQADSLVAPELLTVMAGGAGSGLRINEAEIQNVKGGRSGWADIEAKVQHWVPGNALQLTDDQRGEIAKLLTHVRDRITSQTSAIEDARGALIDATSIKAHRQILADLDKKLTDTGGATAKAAPAVGEKRVINGKPATWNGKGWWVE